MAAVEDRHIVFFRHAVDSGEEGDEVLLRVDVLLPVCGEQDVSAFFQTESLQHVRGLYVGKVLPEDFGHW